MPAFIKSIKLKLWLTFFVTLVISMGGMLVLTHLSVKKRFLEYATQQMSELLEPLESNILEIYLTSGSLKILKNNGPLWRETKEKSFKSYVERQRRLSRQRQRQRGKDAEKHEPFSVSQVKANQRIFFHELALYDQNKKRIVGKNPDNPEQYDWQIIEYQEEIIGYLGYGKPRVFLRQSDRVFMDQQLRSFAFISIALIFASFGFSVLISRWLANPLTQLSSAAQKLAAGEFAVSIPVTSRDELGQLCDNFNEMANTLKANEEARRQWVADISHEMRTPLAVLKAQLEAMEDGIREASPDNLRLLRDKIDSLNTLINDLYELSLSDLGALSYHKTRVILKPVLEAIVDENRDRAAVKGLDLAAKLTIGNEHSIYADIDRLRQLLRNLVENSIRYTDAPGQILVRAAANSDFIEIDVEDSAPTVPTEKQEKIFSRLYRLEESRNRNTGGAGLGLSICKNIVTAHKGEIYASSSSLGGLKVVVKLPKYKPWPTQTKST